MISLTTFLIDRFNNVATEATIIKRFVELIDWHYFVLQFGKVFKEHFSKNGVLCTTNSRVFCLWVLWLCLSKKTIVIQLSNLKKKIKWNERKSNTYLLVFSTQNQSPFLQNRVSKKPSSYEKAQKVSFLCQNGIFRLLLKDRRPLDGWSIMPKLEAFETGLIIIFDKTWSS